ncbi:MAG: KamA family radical SAM protein [Kiritimatiellaceae bacterium]|nr:KamA family radical SAM protein [Kiritimatiellaceae bacterium]
MSDCLQNCKITPYYRNLLDSLGLDHPLRRTVERRDDCTPMPGELADPLGEESHSPVPGLVHTYPDKVLLFATLDCAVYCRYCTRSRLVGKSKEHGAEGRGLKKNQVASLACFQYLEQHTEIRDVLVSGGDPLMLSDADLDDLLSKVRKIKHIRTIRIGSKVPAVLPSRITPELAAILAKHRVWLQLHFIHPAELTAEMTRACDTLAKAGVPMVSQTVLLKGINDDTDTLAELFYGLLERRVKPYYLFQCDPVLGSSSFRTPVEQGLQIIRELQGRISGLAMPTFAIDAPGGGGKISLLPNSQFRREGNEIVLTNYQGKEYRYPDPKT